MGHDLSRPSTDLSVRPLEGSRPPLGILRENVATALFAIVMLLLTGGSAPAIGAGYSNTLFSYAVDLPSGWQTVSSPSAPVVQFACPPREITLRLAATGKSSPLRDTEIARYKQQDESSIKTKSTSYKAIQVVGPKVAGGEAAHYGFVFKDKGGSVVVARFALFSRATPSGHTWVKMHATCPRARFADATKAIDAFLTAFRWVERPEVSPVASPTGPPTPPSQTVVAPEPSSSLAPGQQPTPAKKSENATFWSTCRKKLNAQDAKAFHESFRGDGADRTEEEQALARQRILGGMFQPVKK